MCGKGFSWQPSFKQKPAAPGSGPGFDCILIIAQTGGKSIDKNLFGIGKLQTPEIVLKSSGR
jgi:hypothetical protein